MGLDYRYFRFVLDTRQLDIHVTLADGMKSIKEEEIEEGVVLLGWIWKWFQTDIKSESNILKGGEKYLYPELTIPVTGSSKIYASEISISNSKSEEKVKTRVPLNPLIKMKGHIGFYKEMCWELQYANKHG